MMRLLLTKLLERLNSPVAVATALVIALLIDGFLLYRYQRQLAEPQAFDGPRTTSTSEKAQASSTPSTTQGTTTTAAVQSTTAEGTTASSAEKTQELLRVGVSVVDQLTWLEILVDGQTVLAQDTEPGFSEDFEAEREVTVIAGHASSVEVAVDGESVGSLGTTDAPTTRTFAR
jgi:hypothetical protein